MVGLDSPIVTKTVGPVEASSGISDGRARSNWNPATKCLSELDEPKDLRESNGSRR